MQRILAAALFALFAFISSAHAQNYGRESAVSFVPTVQNAAYSTGNSLGGLQTVPFFCCTPALSAIMDNFQLMSKGGSTVAMTVYIFDTNPTNSTCTDKTAFSLASADLPKLAMSPFVLTPAVVGSGATATLAQLVQVTSIINLDAPRLGNIYVCIVANGAVTPASTSDLVGKISGTLD